MSREKKKRENALRKTEYERGLRRTYEKIFTALGVGAWFRGLRADEKKLIVRFHLPKPTVEIDPATPNDSHVRLVERYLNEILATPSVAGIAPIDWFSVGSTLPAAFSAVTNRDRIRKHRQRHEDAEAILSKAFDAANAKITTTTTVKILHTLLGCTRFDNGPYWCKWQLGAPGRSRLNVVLGRATPETIQVSIDDELRPAYRCGTPIIGTDKVQWISWPAKKLGVNDGLDQFPVYIQSHAIDRLHERINLPGGGGETVVDGCLLFAVDQPKVIRQEGDDFWIEYKLGPDRLGYLVARRLSDKIVIRTFMFLTMQGTPESRLLFEKLRLRRPDIEYNRLDRLDTFLQSDICDDPVICEMLTECGCGHLPSLDIKKTANSLDSTFKQGYATNLRQYLGIGLAN